MSDLADRVITTLEHDDRLWVSVEDYEKMEAKYRKALNSYERERSRFKHARPDLTGEYFLAGGHGSVDSNLLPEYVRIVPAYGCAWEQVYVKTDKTISYEGS